MDESRGTERLGPRTKLFVACSVVLSFLSYFLLTRAGKLLATDASLLTVGGAIVLAALACPAFPVWGPAGFRTPWVYASRRAWVLTQRVAAAVFSALGGAVIWGTLRSTELGVVLLALGGAASALAVGAFSWAAWARADDRQPLS